MLPRMVSAPNALTRNHRPLASIHYPFTAQGPYDRSSHFHGVLSMGSGVDIPAMMRSLKYWEYAAWVATGVVTIGVIGESLHSFTPLFKRHPWWLNKGNKVSSLVLILAIALEFLTGVWTDTTSDRIVQALSTEAATAKLQAATATSQAAKLGVTVDTVQAFVQQKETDATHEMEHFQKVASTEQNQADAAISSLAADKEELDRSIVAVKKDQAELASSLASVDTLRQQVRVLTTHRALSAQQWEALTRATASFGPVPFDMSAMHDSDSPDLAFQIGGALKNAGWDWQARPGLDSLRNLTYPNLPVIGSAFTTGLQVNLCDSDVRTLEPAVDALYAALEADNLNIKPNVLPDAQAKAQNDKCGMLHIVVGSRT